jgi:hypothetical protein
MQKHALKEIGKQMDSLIKKVAKKEKLTSNEQKGLFLLGFEPVRSI